MTKEKIVCAGISYCTYFHENLKKGFYGPASWIGGCSYDAIRESHAYHAACIYETAYYEKEGFITSQNRFVDPIEAQQVAIRSGQYIDPHAKIESLKNLIEGYYLSMKEPRCSQLAYSSFMKSKNDAQAKLKELEAGYLGNEFRVEDLHYGKP